MYILSPCDITEGDIALCNAAYWLTIVTIWRHLQ